VIALDVSEREGRVVPRRCGGTGNLTDDAIVGVDLVAAPGTALVVNGLQARVYQTVN
jgi:hypothetical protein